MKWLPLVFFLICLISFDNGLSQSTHPFQIGTAQGVITPMRSAYIAGHTHNRLFKGVNDHIFVKAVAISNESDSLVIMTFDCIGLLYPQLLEIRKEVKKRLPNFPVNNILMSSTHTHSGPDVVGLWGSDFSHSGVDPQYMDELINIATGAVIDAIQYTMPAKAEFGQSTTGKEWVYNISEPDELDRSLTVLRFVDSSGNNLATLTNFACHPTFLDAVNDKVSSDYVGGYYQYMDQSQGGLNMFLQGSIGGWIQPEHEEKTAQQAFFRGHQLAEKVLNSMKNAQPINGTDIRVFVRKVDLPMENEGFRALSQMGVVKRQMTDVVTTEIAYFEIGNASFATHPGETVPSLSHSTKSMMLNDGPKFILGLGMDALGYILKPYFFDVDKNIPHSTYLCSVSLGPQTLQVLEKSLRELIVNAYRTDEYKKE